MHIRAKRLIIRGFYDGLVDGILEEARNGKAVAYFAIRDEFDVQERRLYAFVELGMSFEELLAQLPKEEYPDFPKWLIQSHEVGAAVSTLIEGARTSDLKRRTGRKIISDPIR